MVGTVQDGKVAEFLVLRRRAGAVGGTGAGALDARDGPLGLMLFMVGVDDTYRLAFAQVAPQILGVELRIGSDDVVGCAQDGRGRPVVLLELDDFELWKVQWQLLQVVQRRTAPAVDRLIVVAHRCEARLLRVCAADQQFEHLVLGGIGVLVFIDQYMADIGLPFLAHIFVLLQQFERHPDEVVEIDALVGAQPLLVASHDARRDFFVVVGSLHLGKRGV